LLSCDSNQLNRALQDGASWKEVKERDDAAALRAYVGCNEPGDNEPRPSSLEICCGTLALRPGDLILLCTDGLTDYLARFSEGKGSWEAESAIERVLKSDVEARGVRAASERLADEANRNGGGDNITLVVVRADAARSTVESLPSDRASVSRPQSKGSPLVRRKHVPGDEKQH
jgi:serine/threonine protein phosphatase PrpC